MVLYIAVLVLLYLTEQIFKIETLKIGIFCFTIAPFSVYRNRLFYFINKDTESSVISSRCGEGMVEDNLVCSSQTLKRDELG